MNAILVTVLVGAVAGLGYVAYRHAQDAMPFQVRETTPGLRDAQHEAVSAERRGDDPAAEREYRQALSLRPDRADFATGLARALIAIGKLREARELLRPLVEDHLAEGTPVPGGSDTLAWYGDLLAQSGDMTEAERAYRAATETRPILAKDLGLAAAAHVVASQNGGTNLDQRRHLRRALELVPGSISVRLSLAQLVFTEGRKEESQDLLAEAKQRTRPGRAEWVQIARAYDACGEKLAALAMLDERVKTLLPTDAKGRCDLADEYRAIAPLPKTDPDSPSIARDPEIVARVRALDDEAFHVTKPTDRSTWARLASLYADESQGGRDDARALAAAGWAKSLTSPKDAYDYAGLAYVYKKVGRIGEGRAMVRQAIASATPPQKGFVAAWCRDFGLPPPPGASTTGGAPGSGVHS